MDQSVLKTEPSMTVMVLKQGCIAFISLALSVFAVFLFAGALKGRPNFFSLALVLLLLLPAFFSLQTVFFPRRGVAYAVMFFEAFGPIVLLLPMVTIGTMSLLLLGAAACFVFYLSAYHDGRIALENSLKFKFRAVGKTVYHHAATGIVLFLSFLSYLVLFVWGGGYSSLADRLVMGVVAQSEYALQAYFPGASFQESADEFLVAVVRSQLTNRGSALEAQVALDSGGGQTENMVNHAAQGLKGMLQKFLGPIDGSRPMQDVLSAALLRFLDDIPEQFRVPLNLFFVFMIFWLLKSTVSFLSFLGLFLAWIILKILLMLGFARIEVKAVEQESIVL